MSRRRRQAGFTLLEMLVASLLLLLGLAIAVQLLGESALQLVDAQAEASDPLAPLVLDRLRGDVRAATGVSECAEDRLLLVGLPAGSVLYERRGGQLHREVYDGAGNRKGEGIPWRGVTHWTCTLQTAPVTFVRLDLAFQQRAWRRSLGAPLPSQRGDANAARTETLFLVPRGGGLGGSW